mmetsp:Transcript_10693/g.29587  ORF Transcript_10693/g.29587 Transcript_10693/m.29587 type:complete len:215 (-) Transcript_10693:664-1308(-)
MRGSPRRNRFLPSSSFDAGMGRMDSRVPSWPCATSWSKPSAATPSVRHFPLFINELWSPPSPPVVGPAAAPTVLSCNAPFLGSRALAARRPSFPQKSLTTAARSSRKLKSPKRKTAGAGLTPFESASTSAVTRASARRRQAANGDSCAVPAISLRATEFTPVLTSSSTPDGESIRSMSLEETGVLLEDLRYALDAWGVVLQCCSARRLHSSWKL